MRTNPNAPSLWHVKLAAAAAAAALTLACVECAVTEYGGLRQLGRHRRRRRIGISSKN